MENSDNIGSSINLLQFIYIKIFSIANQTFDEDYNTVINGDSIVINNEFHHDIDNETIQTIIKTNNCVKLRRLNILRSFLGMSTFPKQGISSTATLDKYLKHTIQLISQYFLNHIHQYIHEAITMIELKIEKRMNKYQSPIILQNTTAYYEEITVPDSNSTPLIQKEDKHETLRLNVILDNLQYLLNVLERFKTLELK